MLGLTLHIRIGSMMLSLCHMFYAICYLGGSSWTSLFHMLVISGGRAICMLCLVTRSMRGLTISSEL